MYRCVSLLSSQCAVVTSACNRITPLPPFNVEGKVRSDLELGVPWMGIFVQDWVQVPLEQVILRVQFHPRHNLAVLVRLG